MILVYFVKLVGKEMLDNEPLIRKRIELVWIIEINTPNLEFFELVWLESYEQFIVMGNEGQNDIKAIVSWKLDSIGVLMIKCAEYPQISI